MSNDLKRYAFDATRGEMFEIAHGAYVKHDDHLTALTAAVQAEREAIKEMIAHKGPVLMDVVVDQNENVYPMIPAGAAHNELVLGPGDIAQAHTADEWVTLEQLQRYFDTVHRILE